MDMQSADRFDLSDRLRFHEACQAVCPFGPRGADNAYTGIGTLSEKTLHAVVKRFIEPDERMHEVRIGRLYADVYNARGIYEIQTRSFDRLRAKLAAFPESTHVTVVYPLPHIKRLIWLDPKTGVCTSPRKSPKRGGYLDAFKELYKLGGLLGGASLSVQLLLIDLDEYRYLDGWDKDGKKGSTRCERIPVSLAGSCLLEKPADYLRLLPETLPEAFTSKELASAAKLRLPAAQTALTVLGRLGAIVRTGKAGRLYLYERAAL